MWNIISKALPWETIFGLVVKLILYMVDKRTQNIEAKEAFLKFIDEIQKDVSVNLNQSYKYQLSVLKERIRQEQVEIDNIKKEKQIYKKNYLKLIKSEKDEQ